MKRNNCWCIEEEALKKSHPWRLNGRHQWRGVIKKEASFMKRHCLWRSIMDEEASLMKRHYLWSSIMDEEASWMKRHNGWRSNMYEEAYSMKRHIQLKPSLLKKHQCWGEKASSRNWCHWYRDQSGMVKQDRNEWRGMDVEELMNMKSEQSW